MRVALYYRVSTKLQQEKFSLSAQKSELNSYAVNQKWQVINEFVDVETGGKLDKAGLNALMDLVESGKIDAVLVMDQDRLSRLDTVSWEFLKAVLRDNEVRIAEPNGTMTDLSNEDDEFMSDLRNLIARREKRMVVKRMMYGKRQLMREGKGWGQAPFEYESRNGYYHMKKEWAWVIPFIDDLYLNKNMGMTLIAKELNKISKTPSGGKWNEHLISTRINTKAFHGIQEKDFATGETISAKVFEAVRTEETYNRLQEMRKKRADENGVYKRTSMININLLKYVPITCAYCGRVIYITQRGQSDKPRFHAHHGRAESVRTGKKCKILINIKRYEYNLVKALKEILQSKELSEKYIEFETNDEELATLKDNLESMQITLKKLNTSKDRLLDLYLDPDMEINKQSYTEKESELVRKIELTENELGKVSRKIAAINKREWNYESLYEYIEIAGRIGTDLTRHEQANIIGDIFTKGELSYEKLVLTTEIYNGIPVDITIPVVDNTWTVNNWMARDRREGDIIYVY